MNLRYKRSNYPVCFILCNFFLGAQPLRQISDIFLRNVLLYRPPFSAGIAILSGDLLFTYFVGRLFVGSLIHGLSGDFLSVDLFIVSLFWPDSIMSRHTVGAHPDSILPH